MAEKATIARPYAQAAFELARDSQSLKQWSEMLAIGALVASDKNMVSVISNPRMLTADTAGIVIDVCGDNLNEEGKNFVRLLAENHRLGVLPEIATLFEKLRADHERSQEAIMISAFPVSDAQRDKVAAVLKARLGREITLRCETNSALLGGAIIKAGDLVIDGSARGSLEKLANNLRQ
ncbi:MAG: F0F1 ATP synthase subunit delta [Gammaproteobacteria bacterium]|nr:F0F1 ATP synthase subunit delta [Gammaproteobacteria bacterium]MDH5593427.1 F0F1 ATP synthase subunit delta [Gammaproteobacteria bacterium]